MSRFSGPQFKGASRDALVIRREQAHERQKTYDRLLCDELRHLRGVPKGPGRRPGRKERARFGLERVA